LRATCAALQRRPAGRRRLAGWAGRRRLCAWPFANDAQRAALLRRLGAAPSELLYEARIEETLDALAEHCERHLDMNRLLEIAR